jgi:putative CocE/NonD family hydrolase
MKIVSDFPFRVENIENVFIPMPDGCRLAARIWLPEGAQENPVPAIFEYIPYRKRDNTRHRDSINHPYFAGHGYACVRVDIRGSGDSEGVLKDQYRKQEQDDGVEIIRWIANQSWCSGKVGMMGISWGGFNSLQVAARRPPELKAILTACSTDDLYLDNMHYMGGCLLSDNLSESSTMFSINSTPPDPKIVGDRWREMWKERLEGSGLWLETWLAHQRRDDYWKHGSVCEDYSAIQCPVYAVGGWADGYTNAVFRLMEHLQVPRKGLIGPWSHKYPHMGIPGPPIGFLQEALRWWDFWLKGKETGIMEEPLIRVWMQDSVPPDTSYEKRPGRWVAENSWPSKNVLNQKYLLTPHSLVAEGSEVREEVLSIQSPVSVGMFAGKWCSYQATPDLPYDQREEDGGALVFESEPLKEEIEIFGRPEVHLEISSSEPMGMIAVRLSDVLPHGEATRVTYGLLNLTHRNGNDSPEPLVPRQKYRVRVPLNGIAQNFPAGHRIRVSLSTSYWPLCWLPPKPFTLNIYTGSSSLTLPVRPKKESDQYLKPFEEPEGARPIEQVPVHPGEKEWRLIRDMAEHKSTLEVVKDEGTVYLPEADIRMSNRVLEWHSVHAEDYGSIRGETHCTRKFSRENRSVKTVAHTVLTSNETHFYIEGSLKAYEGEELCFFRKYEKKIERNGV